MQHKKAVLAVLCLALLGSALAQKNEFDLSIGAMATQDQHTTFSGTCPVGLPGCNGPFITSTSTAVALEGAYTRTLFNFHAASIGVELPLVGVPSRNVTLNLAAIGIQPFTVSQWSIFFTPSAKIRFLPSRPVSPFITIGGGLAHHDAIGATTRGALQFGGGVDFKTPLPHLAVRAEIRDFWAAASSQNGILTTVTPQRVHNVFAGAGVVFKF